MKKSRIILIVIVSAIVITPVVIITTNNYIYDSTGEIIKNTSLYRNANLHIEIIISIHNTYGYNILHNERILIHQQHIPALPGNIGFNTEEDAKKVAEMVIEKIRRNGFLPSVSREELDSLGVLNK